MSKSYYSLGLMSGTSMDGVDASIIQSDGENKFKPIIDEYFELKEKVNLQKNKLDDLSKKFLELKSLAIKYKDNKEDEIRKLNTEIDNFKKMVEESNSLYESMLDRTTKSLEKIIEKAESKSQIQ